ATPFLLAFRIVFFLPFNTQSAAGPGFWTRTVFICTPSTACLILALRAAAPRSRQLIANPVRREVIIAPTEFEPPSAVRDQVRSSAALLAHPVKEERFFPIAEMGLALEIFDLYDLPEIARRLVGQAPGGRSQVQVSLTIRAQPGLALRIRSKAHP